MIEYTWNDIIINPNTERVRGAIGKECYFDDNPSNVLGRANYDDTVNILPLKEIEPNSSHPFIFDGVEGPVAFSCIIIKKKEPSVSSKNMEEPYTVRAKKWIEENNLKEDDYVKITRKAEDNEDGWPGLWIDDSMDKSVDKILKFKGVSSHFCSILLDDGFYYPYFVLEKVDKPEPQYVPFESKEEFIEAFHYHDNVKHSETDAILMNYGMWIKSKYNETLLQVTIIKENGIYTDSDSCIVTWKNLLNDFEFLGRTPCGKEADSYVG